ncbi:MAG: hypothetical protein ACO1QS_18130 [Verrucomicrobiota bacterium]
MGTGIDIERRKDGREFIHWVDASNRIIWVNEAWQEFAQENQAGDLVRIVTGKPLLWSFISGLETRYLFEAMLAKVREGKGPFALPFRCDAPDRRRFMEMNMQLVENGVVVFSSRVLRQEFRESVRLLSDEVARDERFLCSCSWCKQIELSDGKWVEVEEAVRLLALFTEETLPKISHGICPRCTDELETMIE